MGRVLVVGASARAAAEAAVAAGDRVVAVDLFGDTDLRRVAEEVVVVSPADYPGGLVAAAARFPGVPRLYTGGLENHPDAVAALAAGGPLWGNGPAVLRRARDVGVFVDVCREAGCPPPRTLGSDQPLPSFDAGRWLRKGARSSGGRGVRWWDGAPLGPDEVLQEYLDLPSYGVTAVAFGGRAVRVVGVTRQHVGPALGAPPFGYAGSVGPVWLPPTVRERVGRLLLSLTRRLWLTGALGVDFLWDGSPHGRVRPVDLNPRLPGSFEVLPAPTYRLHRRAVGGWVPDQPLAWARPCDNRVRAKGVVYAATDGAWRGSARPLPSGVRLADVPAERAAHRAGDPVVTVLAEDLTAHAAWGGVKNEARAIHGCIGP